MGVITVLVGMTGMTVEMVSAVLAGAGRRAARERLRHGSQTPSRGGCHAAGDTHVPGCGGGWEVGSAREGLIAVVMHVIMASQDDEDDMEGSPVPVIGSQVIGGACHRATGHRVNTSHGGGC